MAAKKEDTPDPGGATPERVTKIEAVRRALAELGPDAKPAEIQPWVREEFGVEMSADHISTYKGAILRKAGASKAEPRKPGRKRASTTSFPFFSVACEPLAISLIS